MGRAARPRGRCAAGPTSPRAWSPSAASSGGEVCGCSDDRQGRVDIERTYFERDEPGYPFRFLDQDVLNAVLCARVEPARPLTLGAELAPNQPYRGLRIVDERRLRCAYDDGVEPYVLHHYRQQAVGKADVSRDLLPPA